MKKLLLILTLLFVGLNFIACAEKKNNRTRLTNGTRSNVDNPAAASGWNLLNSYSHLGVLQPQGKTPYQAARDFVGPEAQFVDGYDNINGVQLRLVRQGNQITSQTRIGLKFFDDDPIPMSYYIGPEMGAQVQNGFINGNQVSVLIQDGVGDIRIEARINGAYLQGDIYHDGNNHLGTFDLPVNKSIFNN